MHSQTTPNDEKSKAVLTIAGCQFAVEADIDHNAREILRLMDESAQRGARVVHFSEAALSGYAGEDFPSFAGFDWNALRRATEAILQKAADHKLWVLLGSAHRLSGDHAPHNSVYVISDQGAIVERYDKRFCTGVLEPRPELDLCHYTPGDHNCVFEIDGWRCGTLICYDYRFPELYRDLKQRGVEVLFQSFHNARKTSQVYHEGNLWKEIVPATLQCRAASNYLWISATNSTTQWSLWPNFCVRPDGLLTGQLPEHEPGVLISQIDPNQQFWDAAGPWRDRAIAGQLHSGHLVNDPRSQDRTIL
jgi:predicted amidohydrolase